VRRVLSLLPLAAAGLIAGCSPAENEGEAGSPKVAFEGKVDPDLAGRWATADKSSVLVLGAEGDLNLTSTYPTPKGKQTSEKKGKWLLGDGKMRLRYALEDGTEETVAYDFKQAGKTMILSTKRPKLTTNYTRQSE
jgi:hypothetical protein